MKEKITQKDEEKLEDIFRQAELLCNSGKSSLAIDKYAEMLGYNDRYDLAAYAAIGIAYKLNKDLPNAIKYFRMAIELKPNSELISIALFHSLLNSGKEVAAFEEARRFLAIRSSKEYDLIFDEMSEELENYKE